MGFDRIRALKIESISEAGGQTDESVTETNIGQDFLDALGLCLQLPGATAQASDAAVYVNRAQDSALQFTDVTSGTLKLAQLLTCVLGKPGSHASVPDFSHWLGAPTEGYASGAFRKITLTGALPSTVTWYTSNAATTRLFSTSFTYTGVLVSQKVHTLYGNNVAIRTLTEAFTYSSGVFAPTITRTWA